MNDKDWVHVLPLLEAMEVKIESATETMREIVNEALVYLEDHNSRASNVQLTTDSLLYLVELLDSVTMLLLRIKHVHVLYRSKDKQLPTEDVAMLQTRGRSIIREASLIVTERERYYRVEWERIACKSTHCK
jgi:hypothetical protein